VWACGTAPNDANIRPSDLSLCAVDVREPLAKVELRIFFCCDALDLHEGGVGSRVALATLVTQNPALSVESC